MGGCIVVESHNINKWLENRQMEEFLKEGESNFMAVSVDSRVQKKKKKAPLLSPGLRTKGA